MSGTYRVVGTGDSILSMTLGFAPPGGVCHTEEQTWVDTEYGRNPYTAGMAGRASTASIWPLVLDRSRYGGWIIIQDNGVGCPDSLWERLIQQIVDETPDDRCLMFIPPVFHPDWNATHAAHAAARAAVMVAIATEQPVRSTIPWHVAVSNDATLVTDGQHPSTSGKIWLRRHIERFVGAGTF